MSWHCREHSRVRRIGWLRAAVLGANDGLVSTTSLVMGMVAAGFGAYEALFAAAAGLVAGAMSMAAGEYVSVHSQADTEKAELAREKQELERNPEAEERELMTIYVKRGLSEHLARQVAKELTEHDAFAAHVHDELGISSTVRARPKQAAFTSAVSFATGAVVPLLVILFHGQDVASRGDLLLWIPITSLVFLAVLGGVAARVGGASILAGAARVTFWGALAMAVTSGVGRALGVAI